MTTPKVGQTVVWQSAVGAVQAEYRGASYGVDGKEATIIVRMPDAPPYQTTVPFAKISVDKSAS